MTYNAFGEAQKGLLRILAHHMILIAERVHIIGSQRADCHILESAYRLWSEKAVFEWDDVPLDENTQPEDVLSILDCCTAHSIRKRGSIGSGGQQSPLPFSNATASSLDSSTDYIFPNHNLGRLISSETCANDDSILGQCFSCNGALNVNGFCQPCLSICLDAAVDGSLALGIPIQSHEGSENRNPAAFYSEPSLEDQWYPLDSLNFGVERQSSQQGLPDLSPPYSNLLKLNATVPTGLSEPEFLSDPAPIVYDFPESMHPVDNPHLGGEPQSSDDQSWESLHSLQYQFSKQTDCSARARESRSSESPIVVSKVWEEQNYIRCHQLRLAEIDIEVRVL